MSNSAIRIVGTRTTHVDDQTAEWFEPLPADAASVAIASAYWDKGSCWHATMLAELVGGPVRLLLWTAGGSRKAWEIAREEHRHELLDLRFLDSPVGGGIFHVKLAAIEDRSGMWVRTLVGSANLTEAAYRRNIEFGVVLDGPDAAAPLHLWFDEQFDAAMPAELIDWDRAIATAPETSEAARRHKLFTEAALAYPAVAPPPR